MENSGEGKTCHNTPPQKRLWTPPPMIRFHPPLVHALPFSLEGTGTDQTDPTFPRPPRLALEGALYSTFPPPPKSHDTFRPPPPFVRRTQEGCGGLGGENPAAFPQARPIFQQPFSLAGKCPSLGRDSISRCQKRNRFPAASKFAKTFPAGNFGQPQPSQVF